MAVFESVIYLCGVKEIECRHYEAAGGVKNREAHETRLKLNVGESRPDRIETAVSCDEAGVRGELDQIATAQYVLRAGDDHLCLDDAQRGGPTVDQQVAGAVAHGAACFQIGLDAQLVDAKRQHGAAKGRDPAEISTLSGSRLLLKIAKQAEGAMKLGAGVEWNAGE